MTTHIKNESGNVHQFINIYIGSTSILDNLEIYINLHLIIYPYLPFPGRNAVAKLAGDSLDHRQRVKSCSCGKWGW